MEDIVLDPSCEGMALAQLVLLGAVMAGAVSGAVAGWLAKRNAGLSLCTFMMGIMGGLLIGTGMAKWLCSGADGVETQINAGVCALGPGLVAGLVGAIPTALFVPSLVIFITLRHVKNRPPRVRTGLHAAAAGVIAASLTVIARVLI